MNASELFDEAARKWGSPDGIQKRWCYDEPRPHPSTVEELKRELFTLGLFLLGVLDRELSTSGETETEVAGLAGYRKKLHADIAKFRKEAEISTLVDIAEKIGAGEPPS